MSTKVGSCQLSGTVQVASGLTEALAHVATHCEGCKVSSPMICVERCDVWKVKNEIFSIRELISNNGHARRLLNAIKNPRRLRILDALSELPRNLKGLQRRLKREGFYHSRSTIMLAYVKPLINAGLVREDNGRFRITFYGRKLHEILHQTNVQSLLPVRSCCYEEEVIKELMECPKTFGELAEAVPPKSLSRILMRLQTKGLLSKREQREYVFYHKTKNKLKTALSPTEKRLFNLIPAEGITARQLSLEAKITLRRTYKYLRRLRDKKLVFALKKKRTYDLTTQGRKIAELLNDMDNLVTSIVVPVLRH